MIVAAVLLGFVTILWVSFLWPRRKYYAFALKMPGPVGLPFIGIGHKLLNNEDILYVLPKIAAEYKVKSFFTWFGPYPAVYTIDPKMAEIILNSPDSTNKSFVYNSLKDLIGEGIITSKSPIWNRHRKFLNPCFSNKVLLDFIPLFNKLAHELCGKLDQHVDKGEVNVKEYLFIVGLKSSIATTFGVDLSEDHSSKIILNSWRRSAEITVDRILNPLLQNSIIFRTTSMYRPFIESKATISNFITKLVTEKLKVQADNGNVENDIKLDLTKESVDIRKTKHILIDQAIKIHQRNEFTYDDIIAEAGTIVFAAYETTNTAIFSTILHLAMYPQYQEKLFEEIITFFPEEEFNVSSEEFKSLVYLDLCINETLRVAPSFPLIGRETTNDVPITKDMAIPKGTQIFIDIFNLHRHEDTWGPGAKIFNPENVLPENFVGRDKYSFMPFSKGQRNCIGWQYADMILRVILVQVLRKYRFSTKFRYEDLSYTYNGTLGYKTIPFLEIQRR